jgi:hypothetical protein
MGSQIAFACGALGGLGGIRMPSAAKTASKAVVNRQSRSRSRNLIVVAWSARSHQQVAGGSRELSFPSGCLWWV